MSRTSPPMPIGRSQSATLLEQRIAQNAAGQTLDLTQWIFERLPVSPGQHVLELCCGTGAQTLAFLREVGSTGRVVAVDASTDALDRLRARGGEQAAALQTVCADIDELEPALRRAKVEPGSCAICFCAYGLYYSRNAPAVLDRMADYLQPDGRLVIVGPFGVNNAPLFELLESAGVRVSDSIRYTCTDFMTAEVLPWMIQRYATLRAFSAVNRVTWTSPEQLINYWANSTFYDPSRHAAVEERVREHFAARGGFVNEKWILYAEATNAHA